MKKILCGRSVYQKLKSGQYEVHGIKIVDVCDSWTASMGLIVDKGMDPYMPDEFSCFSNEAGVAIVRLPWWEANDPVCEESLEETIDLWLNQDDGWRLTTNRYDLYKLNIKDVLALSTVPLEKIVEDFENISNQVLAKEFANTN